MPVPTFKRNEHGIPHIEAEDEAALFFGQGMAHATDRALQLLLMRIVGQGRVSEILDSSDASLRVDKFFRRANWSRNAEPPLGQLDPRERALLQAYCDGVNHVLAHRIPWEFRLCRYRPEPWQPQDTVMLLRMLGYLTLGASQGELERLFIEMVQAGVEEEKLQELFPGILGGLDQNLIKQVKLGERVLPADVWGVALPRMMASNNWVVAGWKSASGKPLLANDVHLEGNRLPAVWHEVVLSCGNRYLIGGTVPGIPGVLSGRNNGLAWSVTYAFTDGEDSWIEECRDGKFYREDKNRWIQFHARQETIHRKHKPSVELIFYENDHGVLDGDPRVEGHYLATRWAPADSGAGALKAAFNLTHATSVERGMNLLGGVETGWSFLLADERGNIGFQMSGRLPKRRTGVSGFVPLPGWKRENDWQGFVAMQDLPRAFNPPEGCFATANEDLNPFGRSKPINLPMGPYRGDRIRQLLAARDKFTVSDMCAMHFDVYSRQAELFMTVLKPLLPDTPEATRLRDWDFKYTADSEGAYLFERFYEQLYREVFGKGGLGEATVDALREQTGAFIDFYHNFDRVLLAEKSAWFGGRSRDEIFREAASVALTTPLRKWGDTQRFEMTNIFFRGKLPRLLGFDRGPFFAIGNRATIHQAQLYTSGGRRTSFLPSFRIVTDLATDEVCTNVAGGPSDRRFSKWYASDIKNWLQGRYKTLSGK
ncbi:MAG: penicillin acylase family protein [Verrucomicrobiae bacterium]|nr:penicillin acylase family protein [Verrucomicrobiae bacterium]